MWVKYRVMLPEYKVDLTHFPMDDSRDGNDDNDDTAAAGANAGHRLGT